ncbi:MAG: DUF4249 domain-containing protein [Bacteroidales bacterium]|nr:DUF4249 domain-containing protein [Bacteroidales bacterium]
MRKLLVFIGFLAGVASCIYPFDPVIDGEAGDMAVFEASIIVGGVSTVRVSKAWSLNWSSTGVYNAVAWVEGDDGTRYDTYVGSSSGREIKIHTENASPDKSYRMVAELDGKKYSSDWIKPLPPPDLESVDIDLSPTGDNVDVLVTLKGGNESTGYLGVYFDETWEFHAEHLCKYELDTLRWEVSKRVEPYPNYWCWKSNTSSIKVLECSKFEGGRIASYPIHSFSRSDNRNHKKYSINVRAVTLPQETYRFMKNLDDISNGTGSLFSPNPGEMVSNMFCESDPSAKVLGYVTVSIESTKRVFIDDRYHVPAPPPQTYFFLPSSPFSYMGYYYEGKYPVDFMTLVIDEREVMGIFWGPKRCIDCVVDGGTKQKPDFWEDE